MPPQLNKEKARRDATPQRADANFWWREQYQFARLTATLRAPSATTNRSCDGDPSQLQIYL